MTTHALAKWLLEEEDLPACFSYNYGDHWNTMVAEEVTDVEIDKVVFSGYHGRDRIADDQREREIGKRVIVLRAR